VATGSPGGIEMEQGSDFVEHHGFEAVAGDEA
jgi:hypothetical protein